MTRILLISVLLLTVAFKTFAQKSSAVKGIVRDTVAGIFLENAVIKILNKKDSTLVNFSRAKNDGSFLINNIAFGNYLFIASYPKYIDFVQSIIIDSARTSVNMGMIKIVPMPILLKEVKIISNNKIIIKGDTIEYNAKSFVVQPNSKVESLLAQLPGLQIDKDGKITAQGQLVSKVLLDGEEFFGDDPTLITRNIRGDMVKKIQIYDKKSNQAAFTGVDDGKKNRTIDIQLKEDKKNGVFGKVEGGIGNKGYYQEQAMVNIFKNSLKFAVFATTSNTGKIGLNEQDNNNYAAVNDIQIFNSSLKSGPDDMQGSRYNGQGIPTAQTGGIHYNDQWNNKKESININYKIGSLEVTGNKNIVSQNNLPEGIINSNNNQDFNNRTFRQKLDAKYEVTFDPTSSLKVYLDGNLKHNTATDQYIANSFNGMQQLLNHGSRTINSNGNNKLLQTSIIWNKNLHKKGRTLSISLDQMQYQQNTKGFLFSQNNYYGTLGTVDSSQITNQQKIAKTTNSNYNSNVFYTEPLTKYLTAIFNYHLNFNKGKSNLLSYNKSPAEEYNNLDSLNSNKYKLNQLTNVFGVTFNYNRGKTLINASLATANTKFEQTNDFTGEQLRRNFVNLNPKIDWLYRLSSQRSFHFNYSGNTLQPTIDQIQPVRNNLDPLNVFIGNPNLDPSFKHAFSGVYNSYSSLSGQMLTLSVSTSFVANDIINNVNTNNVGVSSYRFENLKHHMPFNYSGYAYYGGKLSKIDLSLGSFLNYSNNVFYSMINGNLNQTKSNTLSLFLNGSKQVLKKYSFSLEAGPIYQSNISSLEKELSDKGWGFKSAGSLNIYLPKKIELFTDGNYSYSPATRAFHDHFTRFIWNGGLRKSFLKSEQLTLSVIVNDILNQNTGFENNVSMNSITRTYFSTIKRYCMVSLTWELNKM